MASSFFQFCTSSDTDNLKKFFIKELLQVNQAWILIYWEMFLFIDLTWNWFWISAIEKNRSRNPLLLEGQQDFWKLNKN